MSEELQREVVRKYLARHPDTAFRRAVIALQLLYRPEHLAILLEMARRAPSAENRGR